MAAVLGLYRYVNQLTGGTGTGPHYNVLHVGTDGPGDLSEFPAVTAAIAGFYTAIKVFYNAGATMQVANKVLNLGLAPPTILAVAPSNVVSTGTGTSPAQLAAVLTLQASIASRRGRGRMYIGPLSNAMPNSATGDLSSTNQTTLQTAGNTMVSALAAAGSGWYLAIANTNTLTGEVIGKTKVISVVARSHIFTQRRRGF